MYSFNLFAVLGAIPSLFAVGRNRFSHMGSRFRDDSMTTDLTGLVAIIGILGAIGGIAWLAVRLHTRYENRVVNSPRALFRELCRAHGLGQEDRELLCDIAAWHDLADPVELFLERERFQSPKMRMSLDCDSAAEELEAQLFAEQSDT